MLIAAAVYDIVTGNDNEKERVRVAFKDGLPQSVSLSFAALGNILRESSALPTGDDIGPLFECSSANRSFLILGAPG